MSNLGIRTDASGTFGALTFGGVDKLEIGGSYSGHLSGFRNILINGDMRINQWGVTIAAAANGAYGPDRWKKVDASNMTQIVEEVNYKPSATYTLSGIGVTTQQITSPASGNWTLPNIPITATKVQLEEGSIATPFEQRPIGLELSLCQRYYETGGLALEGYGVATRNLSSYAKFAVGKRVAATMTVTNTGSVFTQGTFNAASISVEGARIIGTKDAVTGVFLMSVAWTASAEL